jgi:autotransporter translocation and assembly factor TamB
MRRLGRGLAVALFVGATLALVVVVLLWAASRTPAFQTFVRDRILAAARDAVDGRIDIGAIGGTLGRTLVLEDVRVAAPGQRVLHVPRIEIAYAPLALLRGHIRLDRVTVSAPHIWLVRAGGRLRLPGVRDRGDEADARQDDGDGMTVEIRRLDIQDGRLAVADLDAHPPRRFAATELTVAASGEFAGGRTGLAVDALRFRPRGLALSPVEGHAHVVIDRDGVLAVDDLRLATARSTIMGAGRVARGRDVDARLALAPLDARDVRALLPASPLRTNVMLRARATGPWTAVDVGARAQLGDAGRIRTLARLDLAAEPLAWNASARFAGLDPAAAISGLVEASLDGRLRAHGTGTDARARLAWELRLAPSRIASQPLDAVRLRGDADGPVHHARGEVAVPTGRAVLRAGARLGPTVAYRVAGRVEANDLAALGVPGWAYARLSVAGREGAGVRHATLRAALTGASLHGVTLHEGGGEATLAGDALEVARLEVHGPALHARLAGTADLRARRADARADADVDLLALGSQLGTGMGGRMRAEATAAGAFDALAVRARAAATTPAYDTLSAGAAELRLDLTGVGGPGAAGTLALDATDARLGTRPPHQVAASADWRRAAGVDRVRAGASARDQETGTEQRAALTLEHTPALTRGELTELVLAPPESRTWRLAQPARFRLEDGVTVEQLTLVAGSQNVTLTGHVSASGANDARLTLREVALRPFCALARRPSCRGRLSGDATVTGTAGAPRAVAHLSADRLALGEVEYGTLAADARYGERVITLHAILRTPRAGEVDVDGTVPLDLAWAGPRVDTSDAPLDVRVHTAELDVAFLPTLLPGTLRHARGALSADVRVTGPRRAPSADGAIAFDGDLELAATGVPYERVHLRATARGRALEVTELTAHAGDGDLAGQGRVALATGGATDVGVRLLLDDFLAVRRQLFEAALSGDLGVNGALDALAVVGDLEVERAVVRPGFLPDTGPPLQRDPTIAVVGTAGEPAEATPATPEATPDVADSLSLAVGIRVARNAWIRRNDANIELAGELRVEKAPFEPVRLSGDIRLVRGWYQFQGRKFDIEEGTITFTGATPPQPLYDIRAVYTGAPEYRITVHIQGSGDKPRLTLSSEPALEQADILAVILFGKPTGQLGRGQSVGLQQRALQLAGGYVMPELRTSVMNTLGLDALDVELPEGTDRPGRVSVGRYVAGDVFLSLAQEFGSRAAEWVSLEYSVTRNISVRGSSSTRGESAIDLFWRRRY